MAMRKALIAAAFWSVFVVDANALEQGGIIVAVDGATHTFTVHWGTINMRYKVTESTVFWVGLRKGAWSDLKIGSTVHVGYHPVGRDRVAYRVEIIIP
jgi:hypothetical protein